MAKKAKKQAHNGVRKFKVSDYKEMPKELRDQLVIRAIEEPEPTWTETVAEVVKEADKGDGVDINNVIVGCYNKRQKILKRSTAYGLLNQLCGKGVLVHLDTGVYGAAK